jgi:hypothetical protein
MLIKMPIRKRTYIARDTPLVNTYGRKNSCAAPLLCTLVVLIIVAVTVSLTMRHSGRAHRGIGAPASASKMRAEFESNGFVLVPDVYAPSDIAAVRREIDAFNPDGKMTSIVDFVGRGVLPLTSALRNSHALHAALREVFDGQDYRFCSHNDVGYGRAVGWHKDRLNGRHRSYERLDPFDEAQRIVKVAIYLQDHSQDFNALRVVRGSHHKREIVTHDSFVLQPKLGWVVIFDQRLTHRGAYTQRHKPGSSARILVSYGFGRNNAYTDQFEAGTKARQSEQLRDGKGAGVPVR